MIHLWMLSKNASTHRRKLIIMVPKQKTSGQAPLFPTEQTIPADKEINNFLQKDRELLPSTFSCKVRFVFPILFMIELAIIFDYITALK